MPIDPTKPIQGQTAFKGNLRSNLQAAYDGIHLDPDTETAAFTVDGTLFGDHKYLRRYCDFSSDADVTLSADDLEVHRVVELVRKGSGNVTAVPGAGVTLLPEAGTGNWPAGLHSTTDLNEALIYASERATVSGSLNPDLDIYLNQNNPATVLNNTNIIITGSATIAKHALIRFSFSSIPAGSTILSATLTVNVTDALAAGKLVAFHKMLVTWDETTSTWNSHTAGISANDAEAESAADFTAEVTATGSAQITVPAASIQDWIDGQTNHGWALLPSNWSDGDELIFNSRTGATPPVLAVSYQEPPTWRQISRPPVAA